MGRLTHLMTDSVWVKTPTGAFDATGIPTYGTAVKLPARVEFESKILTGPGGRTVEASIFIAVETEIDKAALLFTQSDTSDANDGYKVLQVKHAKSPIDSVGHWEVRA